MGITETCSRLMGSFVQAIGVVGAISTSNPSSKIHNHDHINYSNNNNNNNHNNNIINDQKLQNLASSKLGHPNNSMRARALITVFGMQNDGKILNEKARQVVSNLGLIRDQDDNNNRDETLLFDLLGDNKEEVKVEEVLGGAENGSRRNELLHRAFEIFDEDGNGFIEAIELKSVLDCLGLDCGWNMDEIEKMLKVVDLNLDGKVDFGEFELMMMGINLNSSSYLVN